jgi:hypothetical protein
VNTPAGEPGEPRERFEWETEHSPYTPEGQIESAALFGRGLARNRRAVSRLLLIAAISFAVLAVIGLIMQVTD